MTRQRTTVAARKAKTPATLPARFTPRFIDDTDGRQMAVKEIRRRLTALMDDTAAESFQQRLLCERAVFISVQLETMEADAIEGRAFNTNVYTTMANSLLGLLKALGLGKQIKSVDNLTAYLKEREDVD